MRAAATGPPRARCQSRRTSERRREISAKMLPMRLRPAEFAEIHAVGQCQLARCSRFRTPLRHGELQNSGGREPASRLNCRQQHRPAFELKGLPPRNATHRTRCQTTGQTQAGLLPPWWLPERSGTMLPAPEVPDSDAAPTGHQSAAMWRGKRQVRTEFRAFQRLSSLM